MQWPSSRRALSLARTWITTTPAAECATLCAAGLRPVTDGGFTVFWSAAGTVTSLTCTTPDEPGSQIILPPRLVTIALTCMWISMEPMAIVAFCRREALRNATSPFWKDVAAALSFAVCPSTVVLRASLMLNPWQREFVLAASHRLHSRASSVCVDQFVDRALCQPWVSTRSCVWPAAISRWILEFDIEFTLVKPQAACAFVIYEARIAVSCRDAIFLLLLCLFRDGPLRWGERRPLAEELPLTMAAAFNAHPFVHAPTPAPIHTFLAALPVTAGNA